MRLVDVVRDLCRAVDGVDWDAARADSCVREMSSLARRAEAEELDAALDVIVERLARSRIEHGDGVAHAAISGGTLVEIGADPRPLGEVLLAKLPAVLSAARRFADLCIADVDADDPWEGVSDDDVITEVDGAPIVREVFRRHLALDHAGGCSLAYLQQWVLPAVAAWTRDREVHVRATRDEALCAAVHPMRKSEAMWLHMLVATQLDATWRVLCPDAGRGFLLRLDGVASNFDLMALVADALVGAGIPGTRNPPDVIAVIRGERDRAKQDYVKGVFAFHTHRAAPRLNAPRAGLTFEHAVWGEGVPTDVPVYDGLRTLLVTPQTVQRTWSAGRTFSALRASVRIEHELTRDEVRALIARMA